MASPGPVVNLNQDDVTRVAGQPYIDSDQYNNLGSVLRHLRGDEFYESFI